MAILRVITSNLSDKFLTNETKIYTILKKNISFLFLILVILIPAQKIPAFTLRSEVSSYTQFGLRGLNNSDLYIILGSSGITPEISPSYTVYIFNTKGAVTAYHKNTALSSEIIELSESQKKMLFDIINSKKIERFLKYNQEDFEFKEIKKKKIDPLLMGTTYSLTVIQNGKQNTYSYRDIEYHLKSDDQGINKRILKKYAAILDMFGELKADKGH